MSKWIASTDLLQRVSKQLLKPTQQYYSEETIRTYKPIKEYKLIDHPTFAQRHLTAVNEYNESLYGVLIERRESKSEYCIVFMHGLSSNILEGSTLIDRLLPNTALFCFDFSGSGKSQGSINTYGLKEQSDIAAVLQMLIKEGYKQFVLWGRSMGAVASILSSASKKYDDFVSLQILDSPFACFRSVCEFYGHRYMNIPKLLLSPAVSILRESFSSHPFNPFLIDLRKSAKSCSIPTLFVYNPGDEVVPSSDSQELIRNLKSACYYQRIIISDAHNAVRSGASLELIFQRIRKHLFTLERAAMSKGNSKAIEVFTKLLKKGADRESLRQTRKEQPSKREGHRKSAIFCSLSKTPSRFLSPSLKKAKNSALNASILYRKH